MYVLQAVYVPMPRHMYGELARSQIGCSVLEQHKIIHNLLLAAKNDRTPSDLKRAALWGLGHIWYHTIQLILHPLYVCLTQLLRFILSLCTCSRLCSCIFSYCACLLLSCAFYTLYFHSHISLCIYQLNLVHNIKHITHNT